MSAIMCRHCLLQSSSHTRRAVTELMTHASTSKATIRWTYGLVAILYHVSRLTTIVAFYNMNARTTTT